MPESKRGRLVVPSVKKLVLSAVLVGAGAALAAPGAFATFTSTASGGPQTISTGTVTIALGAPGGATNRLTVNASGVAPGDTISRSVDLTNSGSLNLASVTLGMSATTSSALDTDSSNGLQVTVQSCSVAWTEAGPPYTYTCSGTATTLLASTSVSAMKTAPVSIAPLNALTAGGTDHLEVILTLPSAAPNSFQNLSSTVTYDFTGTQRAAQAD
jgi:spore coat-associated protein N